VEKLAEVDTVLLDKTGTLTYGTPEVIELRPAAGVSEAALLEAAAIAEARPSIRWLRRSWARRPKWVFVSAIRSGSSTRQEEAS
jgi:P-type E1-E2 ATPase